MTSVRMRALIVLSFAGAARGQTSDGKPAFDALSIKRAAPPVPGRGTMMGMRGGPGDQDPALFRCTNCAIPMRGETMPAREGGALDGNAPLSSAPGPADFNQMMISAIQSELGLRLESKKGRVETIVVDHIEKAPTEN